MLILIEETDKLNHWNYFLALESDIEKLSRYIEFTKDNYEAYSIEMVRLLLSAASEVDVIAKLLCKREKPDENPGNMDQYREILNPNLQNINDIKIQIPRYGLNLIPWKNWKTDENPDWWKDHNAVKHKRNLNFQKANLKNTLNSISGLFCLLLYYYKDEAENGDLFPDPNLFMVEKKLIGGKGSSAFRYGSSLVYKNLI